MTARFEQATRRQRPYRIWVELGGDERDFFPIEEAWTAAEVRWLAHLVQQQPDHLKRLPLVQSVLMKLGLMLGATPAAREEPHGLSGHERDLR